MIIISKHYQLCLTQINIITHINIQPTNNEEQKLLLFCFSFCSNSPQKQEEWVEGKEQRQKLMMLLMRELFIYQLKSNYLIEPAQSG